MNYQLVIDPDLGVSTDDFADAWNETPSCRTLAEAQVSTLSPKGVLIDARILQEGLILLAGTVGGLALDALKDAVKDKLTAYFKEKLSRKPSLKVEAIRQPDGAYLLVVKES